MSIEEYTGLEFLNAVKDGVLPHSRMAAVIPMKLVEAKQGYIIYEVTPNENHLNLQGGIHGGFCATILDSATGAAAQTVMEKGMRFATTDLNIKMIRPMQANKTYRGIGKLINVGRTLVTTEAVILDENDKIYAHGSATLMIIRK